ncbi:helicase domain-containing protein [Bradyrhizobium elkanii USDA 61]|nr:helicase domain-containing protein [Bradyrhizobium elkanii USDA 61]
MRSVLKRTVCIYDRACCRRIGATGSAALEWRGQGTDRRGILCSRRGRLGRRAAPRSIAAAFVDLAQGGARRVVDVVGTHGAGGDEAGWSGRDPGSEFIKRRGF